MKIIKREESLYLRYEGQHETQPVYVEINPERETLRIDCSGEIGNGMPEAVWHDRILRYHVPVVPTVTAANKLLRELLPLAEQIVDGHSIEWDGRNHVGYLEEDAQESAEELECVIDRWAADLDDRDTQQVWDEAWLWESIRQVDADTTDAEIKAMVAEIEAEAEAEDAEIDCDLRALMIERRAELAAEIEE